MAKNLICLLVGLALVLTPFLVSAEQPDMEAPDPQVPEYICLEDLPIAPDPQRPHQYIYLEPPPMEAPERPMHEYIYQTGTPDLERVKSFYESQEEVLGQRVMELLDYVDSPGGPAIIGAGYGADGYYCVLLDSWNDNWDVIDRTVEQLQELGGEDFPIAFWVGTVSCAVETLDAEEVETEVGLESEIVETESIFNVIERNPRHPQGEIVEIAGPQDYENVREVIAGFITWKTLFVHHHCSGNGLSSI